MYKGDRSDMDKMRRRPLVSIIIAAFNCEGTVEASVTSCLEQTREAEVVVVDDGSTDGTGSKLRDFGNRIVLVTQPNRGLAAARNAGVAAASGDYVAWMDADDLARPERVEAEARVLDEHADVVLVSSDFSAFREEATDVQPSFLRYYYGVARREPLDRLYPHASAPLTPTRGGPALPVRIGAAWPKIVLGNYVHPPTVMVRRETMLRAGRFDEGLRYTSDCEYLMRLARLGAFGYVDAPLLRYRLSASQMSRANQVAVRLETARTVDRVRREHGNDLATLGGSLDDYLAHTLVAAATQIGWRDRRRALSLLSRSWHYSPQWRESALALLHTLPPRAAVSALKRVRALLRES